MKSLARTIASALDANLGRCPKCATTSFLFMVLASCLALAAGIMTDSPSLLITSKIAAAGFAGLWFSHLGAFALRTAQSTRASTETALHDIGDSDPSLNERRKFLFAMARSLMFAMTATAWPFRKAFAADCSDFCDEKIYKCCWDYDGKQPDCAPLDAVCCAGKNPWHCPKDHNCKGDSGDCT